MARSTYLRSSHRLPHRHNRIHRRREIHLQSTDLTPLPPNSPNTTRRSDIQLLHDSLTVLITLQCPSVLFYRSPQIVLSVRSTFTSEQYNDLFRVIVCWVYYEKDWEVLVPHLGVWWIDRSDLRAVMYMERRDEWMGELDRSCTWRIWLCRGADHESGSAHE